MYELSNILVELIFILLHFFVFLVNYLISRKNLFYPPALFSFLWTAILLLHFICGLTVLDKLFTVSFETFFVLLIGSICFSMAGFIVAVSDTNRKNLQNLSLNSKVPKSDISITIRLIFVGIIIAGIPFYLQASYRVFLASQIDNFFVGLRTELSYGEENIGPTKYLVSFSFVVFAICYYAFLKEGSRVNKVLLALSLISTLVYAVFATGRSYYFMILSIYLGINYLQSKTFSIKRYAKLMLIFMILFVLVGLMYNKGGNSENSLKENLNAATETTAIYLVTAINALDIEVRKHIKPNYEGDNTLRFFIIMARQQNVLPNKKIANLVQEFVFIPYPTNVYTFYSPYLRDFGKGFAWIMIALFGALHTWIYQQAIRSKNLRSTFYYSILLFPLLMSFFTDQYLSLFSTWLQMVFYIELFLAANKLFTLNDGRN